MGAVFSGRKTKCRLYELRLSETYPSYYVANVLLTNADEDLTNSSWKILMSGESTENFRANREHPSFHYSSCLTWFYDIFFSRFFYLSPDVVPMFENVSMVHQGKLLATVIASALNSLKKPVILRRKLIQLVSGHNGKGVKGVHYGNMGAALFWSLEQVLGTKIFNDETKQAWIRMYSFLLSIIIPPVVKFSLGKDYVAEDVDENSSTRVLFTTVSGQNLRSAFSALSTSTKSNTDVSALA